MDWTTIIVSCLPGIVAALISYLTARYQWKNDLNKATQENNATIERLMKQHEIDIGALREKHKIDMEIKDKEQEHKLQLMQKECELKIAESQAQRKTEITNDVAANFMQLLIKDPKTANKTFDSLLQFKDKIVGNK